MRVKCSCGKVYEVSDQMIGKAVRCAQCGRNFVVPTAKAPSQVNTLQVTAPVAPPSAATARPRGAGPTPTNSTQWVAAPVTVSDAKDRAEREKQLISQYVPYVPKPGEKLVGPELAKSRQAHRRREGRKLGFTYLSLGIGLEISAVAGYFALQRMDTGEADRAKVHWIMAAIYAIGGKWAAAIGLGLIGLILILVATLYFAGVFGNRDDA